MPITNQAAFEATRDYPTERHRIAKSPIATLSARASSSWLWTGEPAVGVAPTTAIAPTNVTVGALGQNAPALTQRLLKAVLEFAVATGGAMITICDRLSTTGGLSGIVTTAQTTNLPTASLTRRTSGVGVEQALEIYTAIGTTLTSVTTSYTNTGAVAGQVTPSALFGSSLYNAAGRIVLMPLASGDKGTTAVASVTVLATTGTAGNFGVTLYYPIVSICIDHMQPVSDDADGLYGFGTLFPAIDSGACLFFIVHSNAALTTASLLLGDLNISEEA